jgi:hypothetical protein
MMTPRASLRDRRDTHERFLIKQPLDRHRSRASRATTIRRTTTAGRSTFASNRVYVTAREAIFVLEGEEPWWGDAELFIDSCARRFAQSDVWRKLADVPKARSQSSSGKHQPSGQP